MFSRLWNDEDGVENEYAYLLATTWSHGHDNGKQKTIFAITTSIEKEKKTQKNLINLPLWAKQREDPTEI